MSSPRPERRTGRPAPPRSAAGTPGPPRRPKPATGGRQTPRPGEAGGLRPRSRSVESPERTQRSYPDAPRSSDTRRSYGSGPKSAGRPTKKAASDESRRPYLSLNPDDSPAPGPRTSRRPPAPGKWREKGRPPAPDRSRNSGRSPAAGGSRPAGGASRPRKIPAGTPKPAAPRRPLASGGEAKPRRDGARDGVRVQKVLSEAGIASRRAAEELIRQGRVLINGQPAELGQRIDASSDRLEVDGQRVQIDLEKKYLVLNKPEGVITTSKDPEGRTTVLDIIGVHERVFPVGRLDIATEGLLLLTNDGELTHRLTHPSFEVTKTYVAEVAGLVGRGLIRKLTETGVELGDPEPFTADDVRVIGSRKGPAGNRTVIELDVHEGPKHLVRRLLEAVDRPVIRLVRTGVGPLKLGRLSSGTYRHLTQDEVDALYREVGL